MEGPNLTSHNVGADNSTGEAETADTLTFLQEVESYMTFKVAKWMGDYWFPVLVPLGLIGNTLSFFVMIRPSNRKVSTCIYMAAISVNDNLVLLLALHAWLATATNIHDWHSFECKMSVYLAYTSLQIATYQVLVMTIDKYVAVKWPHKAATYIIPKRAKSIILAICILVLIYNLPHFFITTLVKGECFGYSVESIFTKAYSWFTIVINAFIPFIMLIHMNYVIVKTVRNSRKMFISDNGTVGIETRQKTMKSAENQLTTMLLLVTTLFLILVLTTYLRFIYTAFLSSDTPSKFATSIFLSGTSYKLCVTNSGINFFLYCISGKKFRNDLKEIVCCNRRSNSSSVNLRSNINTISSNSCC